MFRLSPPTYKYTKSLIHFDPNNCGPKRRQYKLTLPLSTYPPHLHVPSVVFFPSNHPITKHYPLINHYFSYLLRHIPQGAAITEEIELLQENAKLFELMAVGKMERFDKDVVSTHHNHLSNIQANNNYLEFLWRVEDEKKE